MNSIFKLDLNPGVFPLMCNLGFLLPSRYSDGYSFSYYPFYAVRVRAIFNMPHAKPMITARLNRSVKFRLHKSGLLVCVSILFEIGSENVDVL